MQNPDWLAKALLEGTATARGVNYAALAPPVVSNTCPLDKDASEAEFQKVVIELAHSHGWKVGHFRKVRVAGSPGSPEHWETPVAADGKGWPDLFLAKPGFQPIIAELKVKTNTPRPEQWEWLRLLRSSGLNAVVWYPSDWQDIVETITHGRPVDPVELARLADDGNPHGGDC